MHMSLHVYTLAFKYSLDSLAEHHLAFDPSDLASLLYFTLFIHQSFH